MSRPLTPGLEPGGRQVRAAMRESARPAFRDAVGAAIGDHPGRAGAATLARPEARAAA